MIEVSWNAEHKALSDDNAVGVTTICDAPGVLVREVVSERHIWAELLEPRLALWACAVRVHHAAHRGNITGFELGNSRTDLRDPANNFMARHQGIDRGHNFLPLIAGLVQIGVADAAEKNFDLNIVFSGIAPRDRSGSKRRCCADNGIGF